MRQSSEAVKKALATLAHMVRRVARRGEAVEPLDLQRRAAPTRTDAPDERRDRQDDRGVEALSINPG